MTDPIKPTAGSPSQPQVMTDLRLGQLKHLAYHSSSLDDMGDAIIELIEEAVRLKKREAELVAENDRLAIGMSKLPPGTRSTKDLPDASWD